MFAACLLLSLASTSLSKQFDPALLSKQPVQLDRPVTPLSSSVKSYLQQRDGDTALVWVMFTDKGDAGGELRRVSRWLNGASFAIPSSRLDAVAALPFVREVKPLGLFRRPGDPVADPVRVEMPDPKAQSPDALNYGLAFSQLTQINVQAMHDEGYDGSGVTLAIFDTGYRKSHEVFAQHYTDGRVLAEYDFIFDDTNTANEGVDWGSQWNHGTYIWSTAGGFLDGTLYGPAYRANFILCKTEDVRSETPVEEDNWVAALEWVDSIGADVVTSSLSYLTWDGGGGYTQADLDGETAVTTIAASMAASMGIVICNSAGNSGPSSPSLSAPVDAFDIIAVGAVNSSGALASFSSRGPTADGRIKPEVCARGVSTQCALASSDTQYGGVGGTSLSTPLVAGVACLLIQARPNFTPQMIRAALMETADNAATPNNNFGWGIVNAGDALGWGADFSADITFGNAPATVQFTDLSTLTHSTWTWSFGDNDSAFSQNPSHTYIQAGAYDVSLKIDSEYGDITRSKSAYVILLADTVKFTTDSAYAGQDIVMAVDMTNSQQLNELTVSFQFDTSSVFVFDSASLGSRTLYFEDLELTGYAPSQRRYAYTLRADDGGGSPPLEPGQGEILKLHISTNSLAFGEIVSTVDSAQSPKSIQVTSPQITYDPAVVAGTISTRYVLRGDVDGNLQHDIADIVALAQYMFNFGPAPVSVQAGDANANFGLGVDDLVYLVDYFFSGGPPPPTP